MMVSVWAGATVEQFEQAKSKLSTMKNDPGNEAKLKIYALFKQVGDVPDVPDVLDSVQLCLHSGYIFCQSSSRNTKTLSEHTCSKTIFSL